VGQSPGLQGKHLRDLSADDLSDCFRGQAIAQALHGLVEVVGLLFEPGEIVGAVEIHVAGKP